MTHTSELVRTVIADLAYLRAQTSDWADDDALRRASPVIRRLIVEKDLQRAWREAGLDSEPRIRIPTLDSLREEIPLEEIRFASAGGAIYRGIQVSEAVLPIGGQSKWRVNFQNSVKDIKLNHFINATAVIINGKCVSRRTVVKYVANKLGGVHFDDSRGLGKDAESYELLDTANRYKVRFELDGVETSDKSMVYFELLSAAQAVARSIDIQLLTSQCP